MANKTVRQLVVEEILQTEISYVKSLLICENHYHKKLQQDENMNQEEVTEVFRDFDQIIAVNTMFEKNLTEQKDKLEDELINEFQKIIPFFKAYKQFVGYNESSFKIISKWEKQTYASNKLDDLRDTIPDRSLHDLKSMLIMPIQRIPRYVLLLKEFKKNTDQNHKDYNALCETLTKMEEVAKIINESIKESERRLALFRFTSVIPNYVQYCEQMAKKENEKDYEKDIVQAHRYFIQEGVLTKVCRKANKSRYFLLFNDMIIYGEGNKDQINITEILKLKNTIVEDCEDNEKFPNGFRLRSINKGFVVLAESKEMKDLWFKNIFNAIETYKKERKLDENEFIRPVFVPDSDSPDCNICHKKFTTFFRRHHCRKCGRCICGDCSKGKLQFGSDKNNFERVCKECFKEYVDQNPQEEKLVELYEKEYGKKQRLKNSKMSKSFSTPNDKSLTTISSENCELSGSPRIASSSSLSLENSETITTQQKDEIQKENENKPTENEIKSKENETIEPKTVSSPANPRGGNKWNAVQPMVGRKNASIGTSVPLTNSNQQRRPFFVKKTTTQVNENVIEENQN